jgi:hypothetical protein
MIDDLAVRVLRTIDTCIINVLTETQKKGAVFEEGT